MSADLLPLPAGSSGHNSLALPHSSSGHNSPALLHSMSRQNAGVPGSLMASPFGIPLPPYPNSAAFCSVAPSQVIRPQLPIWDVADEDLPEPTPDAITIGGEVCGKSQVGKKGAGPGRLRVKGKETGGVTKRGKSGGGEEMTRKSVKGRKPGAKGWSEEETWSLLQCVSEVLAISGKGWGEVAIWFNAFGAVLARLKSEQQGLEKQFQKVSCMA